MPSTSTNRQDCIRWLDPEATWLGPESQYSTLFCRMYLNATAVILTLMASRSVCGWSLYQN
jgi:hypothetical protein